MKKLTILYLLILALISAGSPTAFAATGTPHIIIDGEVWLLDDGGNRLFLLPDTYYAKINNLDDTYYYVTFNGVSGKVSKNVVTTTGYHTTAPGTSAEIKVNDNFSDFVSISLKAAPSSAAQNIAAVPTPDAFTFLGHYPTQTEGVWYYCKYGDYYGYIKQDRTTMTELNIGTFVPEAPQETEEKDPPKNLLDGLEGKELRILIIIGLAIPAVLIIFLLFRPQRNRKYYD